MKLYGADLLLLACVRIIKVQGFEFEAAENNLSELEIPNEDKFRSAYEFLVRYLLTFYCIYFRM